MKSIRNTKRERVESGRMETDAGEPRGGGEKGSKMGSNAWEMRDGDEKGKR